MRTFIALPLSPPVITAYARWQQQCEPLAPRLKWVAPPLLHVTIRFLGELADERVEQVKEAVAAAAGRLPAGTLQIGGRGLFPDARRPQVFWLGVEPREWLARVADEVDQQLAHQGWSVRTEPLQAHLTVARTRRDGFVPTEFVAAWLAQMAGVAEDGSASRRAKLPGMATVVPGFTTESLATELVVMESLLRPGGPLYIPQGRYQMVGR